MASVSKRPWKGPNGEIKTVYAVRYREPGGKHRQKSFDLKKDAETYRRKVEREIEDGQHVPASEALFVAEIGDKFVLHSWTRHKAGQIGQGRYDVLAHHVEWWIKPYFVGRRMAELNALDVEAWVHRLRTEPRKATGRPLSPNSTDAVMTTFRIMEDYAIKHRFIAKRFVSEGRREVGPLKKERIRTFTIDEVKHLVRCIEQPRTRYYRRDLSLLRCYVYLAAFCGLRYGEISGLKAENIDFDQNVIRVRNSLTEYGVLKGPKTKAGVRDVPMPPQVRAALEDWLSGHYQPHPAGVTFTHRKGLLMNKYTFITKWRVFLKSAGLDQGGSLHFHALRHFAASYMIEHRIPLQDVARMLGHESFDTTLQVYAHSVADTSRHLSTFSAMAAAMTAAVPALSPPGILGAA